MISLRRAPVPPVVTMTPPLPERANAAMARSISRVSPLSEGQEMHEAIAHLLVLERQRVRREELQPLQGQINDLRTRIDELRAQSEAKTVNVTPFGKSNAA